MAEPQTLLITADVARILGCSDSTVHRLVKDGKLTPVLVAPGGFAGAFMFDPDEVERVRRERAA